MTKQLFGPTVDTELIDDVTLYSAKLIIPVTGPVIIDGAVAIHGDRVVHVVNAAGC